MQRNTKINGQAGIRLAGMVLEMIERLLEYWPPGLAESVPVRVCIGAPESTPEGNYQSTLSIEGLEFPYDEPFKEVDPLGAVLEAATMARFLLIMLTKGRGRLTWRGSHDLGFPLLTPPKHSWYFSPANGDGWQTIAITIAPPQKIGDRWASLVTFEGPRGREERWIQGETWAQALERGAAAVPAILQEFAEKAGDGEITDDPP
jgi:hypothetical protein